MKMKTNRIIITVAIILLCFSTALMLYPTASQMINKMFDKNSIVQYNNQVSTLDTNRKSELLKQAQAYNESLVNLVTVSDAFSPDAFNVGKEYENILSITDDGLIGSVTIPKIDCNLPIYHGVSEDILNKGAVHMANTSFPIGGDSTHAVVSAHTAYPGKEFFNRLTELEIGDYFYINVLGDTHAYKVCRIDVVLPTDSQLLNVEKHQDLVTLVTCTPYSVNTHRLLVRGQRDISKENEQQFQETANPKTNYKFIIVICIAIAMGISLIAFFIAYLRKRKKRKELCNDK